MTPVSTDGRDAVVRGERFPISWGIAFQLTVDRSRTVNGTGTWELTRGPLTVDRGTQVQQLTVDGFVCQSASCTMDGVGDFTQGDVLFDTRAHAQDGLLLTKARFGDTLAGVCAEVTGRFTSDTGTFSVTRGAARGPARAAPPPCAAPSTSCDSEPRTCEVNALTDSAHCGICGRACAQCNQGRCEDGWPRHAIVFPNTGLWCVVDAGDLVCGEDEPGRVPVMVRAGDVAQVTSVGVPCILTTAGEVECFGAGGTLSAPGWTKPLGPGPFREVGGPPCAITAAGEYVCSAPPIASPRTPHALHLSAEGRALLAGGRVVEGKFPAIFPWEPVVAIEGPYGLTPAGEVLLNWGTGQPPTRLTFRAAVRIAAGPGTDFPDAMRYNAVAALHADGSVSVASSRLQVAQVAGIADGRAAALSYHRGCALRAGRRVTCWEATDPSVTWDFVLP